MTKLTFIAGLGLATFMSLAPVQAAPNAQLVASVQQNLKVYGFRHVDASKLTSKQISALHLKLSNSVGLFGLESIRRKQEIKVILGWTE